MVIALALFDGDERLTSAESLRHISAALAGFSQPRMQAVLGLPRIAIGPTAKAGERGRIYLRETLGRIIDGQRHRATWLGGLVAALEEKFGPADGRRLAIDNALTFYLAGHETTANALSWTLYLLARQPELQEALAEEARAARDAADWPTPGLAARLPRLHAALQESLRLYPPAPRFDRQARAALRIGDHDVQPGDLVSIWPWLVHRNRQWWDDPDAFQPDRFLSGERHRFQYLPFGAGPRICVGSQFAIVEALAILAQWLASWRFVDVGAAVRPSGLVTLRPAPGVRLRVEARPI
jgi:cytochrome P450